MEIEMFFTAKKYILKIKASTILIVFIKKEGECHGLSGMSRLWIFLCQ